jgi:hypothetical protein
VSDRLLGILLFLPVPVVLVLFTRQPFGAWASLGAGVVLVLTHRAYARPFALARKERRCLWCGGAAPGGPALELREPMAVTSWRACGAAHHERVARTLGWAASHRARLAVAILGSLLVFLAAAGVVAAGRGGALVMADAVAVFRLGVALAVLPLGWLGPGGARPATANERLPFPVHVQALVGTLWVVWLFRLVGLWWLFASLHHLVRRAAL